jgi:hypothetical protein
MSIAFIIYTAFIFQANAHPGKLFKYQKVAPLSLMSPIHLFWTHYTFQSHFFSTKSKNVLSYQDKERITDTFIIKAQLNAKYDFYGEHYLNEQDSQDLKNQIIKGNLQLKSSNQRKFIAHHLSSLCDSIHWIKTLKLGDLHLKKLPDNFSNLQQLEKLDLSSNEFYTFPNVICQLETLKELVMHNNHIKIVPRDIKALSQLEYFNLSWNELNTLPTEIGELKALKTIWLCRNNIGLLPESIGYLMHLRHINLSYNENLQIPESFLMLKDSLEEIFLLETNLKKDNDELQNAQKNIDYDDLRKVFQEFSYEDNCFYTKKE